LANTAQLAAMPTPLEQGCCYLFLPEVPSTENTKATKKEINQTKHNHGTLPQMLTSLPVQRPSSLADFEPAVAYRQ